MKTVQNFKTSTTLEKEVKEMILNTTEEEREREFIEDLLQHGCISGMVSGLTDYSDTVKFFESNRKDINSLLSEMIEEIGFSCPSELFGEKWDKEDPLAIEQINQNLLAWFAFEETARKIADFLEIEI